MRFVAGFFMFVMLLVSCGNDTNTGDSGDTGDTGNSGNTGDTGNTGDSVNDDNCTEGAFLCSNNAVHQCESGAWKLIVDCVDKICDETDGKCKNEDEIDVDDSENDTEIDSDEMGDIDWIADEYTVSCSDTECNVPAGSFMMGCNETLDSECGEDELPYHEVNLSAYKIDKYEVTVGQFEQCVDAGSCNGGYEPYEGSDVYRRCNFGSNLEGVESYPMNCVDWSGAKAYCEWAGKRLPTEAEWEKAARGTDGRKYPWGNELVNCDYAVTDVDASTCEEKMKPVGSLEAGRSPYGTYDMIGNVWEWTNDWYRDNYYEESSANDPAGPDSGEGNMHVSRGGAFDYFTSSFTQNLRASNRGYFSSTDFADFQGFRCAISE